MFNPLRLILAVCFCLVSCQTQDSEQGYPATLHGYPVRGRALLDNRALRIELLEAFANGTHEEDGMVAGCFNPRHAIVAEVDGNALTGSWFSVGK